MREAPFQGPFEQVVVEVKPSGESHNTHDWYKRQYFSAGVDTLPEIDPA